MAEEKTETSETQTKTDGVGEPVIDSAGETVKETTTTSSSDDSGDSSSDDSDDDDD